MKSKPRKKCLLFTHETINFNSKFLVDLVLLAVLPVPHNRLLHSKNGNGNVPYTTY